MANEALTLGKSQTTVSRLSSYDNIRTKLNPLKLRYRIEKDKLIAFVAKIQEELPSPKDMSLDYQNNAIKVVPSEKGTTLDSDLAIKTMKQKSLSQLIL